MQCFLSDMIDLEGRVGGKVPPLGALSGHPSDWKLECSRFQVWTEETILLLWLGLSSSDYFY